MISYWSSCDSLVRRMSVTIKTNSGQSRQCLTSKIDSLHVEGHIM